MTSENSHAIRNGTRPQAPPTRRPPDRSVLALLRAGTRGCRFAAALLAVVVGVASQVGNQAVAQAKQTRLYLDAPVVSAERASRAGEVANAYSTPGSPASREVLAWLEVRVRPVDVSPPPEGAREAFASIVARDGGGPGGVTPDDALAAGEVMLAQIEGSPPKEDGDGGTELASGAVRPQLGDGTRVPEANANYDAEEKRPAEVSSPTYAGSSAYASTGGVSAPAGESSGGSGVPIPAPSPAGGEPTDEAPEQAPPTELASAPSGTDATPALVSETDEETYGATGPISDTGQAPTILIPASPTDAGDGDEQPYPEESVPASEPEPVPVAAEEEPAGTKSTAENTGLTSDEGDELALVPIPPPADEKPAAAEDDSERVEDQAPVALPSDGGGSQTAHADPLPSTEAETAYAEPSRPAEEVPEDSDESDPQEAPSTEVLVAEADEEQVEIVVGDDEAPAQNLPENGPPPEHVPPAEASPGWKEAGEDASPYGDTQWGTEQEQTPADDPSSDDTQWGRPSEEEDPPAGREPAGDLPPVEEPPYAVSLGGRPVDESPEVEPPEMVLPPEEPTFTGEEASPEAALESAPRALPQDDATEAPPEAQQPGSDYRPEDPEYAVSALPGDRGAAQDSRGRGQEEEQRGRYLRQDGPRGFQNRLPKADPVGPVEEQIKGNDGVGGAAPGDAQIFFSQTAENAGAIRQEQAVVIEEGEASEGMDAGVPEPPLAPDAQTSVPEPLSQAAPRTTEEPVAAEPVQQITPAPTQAAAEEPTARQYDESARPASTRPYDPASQPDAAPSASRTGAPTASEPAAPEGAPEREAASQKSLAGPETEPKTEQTEGKENR